MTGEGLAFLLARLFPFGAQIILDLLDVWTKEMTPEELRAFCLKFRKSEEAYVEAERSRRLPPV